MKQTSPRLVLLTATLTLLVTVALPATQAAAALRQVSDDGSGTCGSAAPSGAGLVSPPVFESLCDLVGSNPDGNRELFRSDAGGALTQLTDTADCTNANASINDLGDMVSFDSDCDITGGNADGNVEIFQITSGGTSQLTDSSTCSNGLPSSSEDGTVVAFESDCDFTGQNGDRNSEIWLVSSAGVVTQLSDDSSASFCGSFFPSINGAGDVVAFESDCDLSGDNDDQLAEIFSVTSLGAVTRLTFGNDSCDSFLPSTNSAGDLVAFESDCNLAGSNGDGSVEIFTVAGDQTISQLTDDSGDTSCWSVEPVISPDGTEVVFTSFCDLAGINADQSFEIFTVSGGGVTQISDGTGCSSSRPSFAFDGSDIAFQSDCDLLGTNMDGSTEVFNEVSCVCGSPANGVQPPTATDALFVLRAAVGQAMCRPCECDVDSSLTMTASDALIVLQNSVGQSVPLVCP